ncbi:MAG: hypothetical protein LH468_05985 [Nocardioides sp.]|nr:hypothetical protein [Nocardioides sp.]
MSVRVYVPVSEDDLAALVTDGRLPGPRCAHAVTEELRASWPEAGDDSWEYAALMAAAIASRVPGTGRRRVVAADVSRTDATTGPDDDPTRVDVPGDVVWKGVAAAHVDPADGAADDDDLAWFATQEIVQLLTPG